MDTNTWTWAFTLVLDALASLFGSALTVLGVATLTLLVLLWLHTIVRLIVAPIIGRAYGNMLDNAMFSTRRQNISAIKENDKTAREKRKMYYKN